MFRRLAAASLGFLGLLGAHELTYRLVGGHAADELLAHTGHGWQEQLPLLILAAVLALVIGSLGGLRRSRPVSLGSVLAFQVSGYATIEVLERVVSGHHALPSLSLVLVGAAMQLPVAVLVWFLHRVVVEVVEALLSRAERRAVARSRAPFPTPVFAFLSRALTGSSPRAPPFCTL
jgi:hypothetical protein